MPRIQLAGRKGTLHYRGTSRAKQEQTIGRLVMATMGEGTFVLRPITASKIASLKKALAKVHTPGGRKKAISALGKVNAPLYSVSRQRTGRYRVLKGRVAAGRFVRSV